MNHPRSYLLCGSITIAFISSYFLGPLLEKGFGEAWGVMLSGMSAWYFIGILFVLGLLSFIAGPSYLSVSRLRASREGGASTARGGGGFRKRPLLVFVPQKFKNSVGEHPQAPKEADLLLALLLLENLLKAEIDTKMSQALAFAAILHASRTVQNKPPEETRKLILGGLWAGLWRWGFPLRRKSHLFLQHKDTPFARHVSGDTSSSKQAFPEGPLREGFGHRGAMFRRLSSLRGSFFTQRLTPTPKYLIPPKREPRGWFHVLRDTLTAFFHRRRRPSIAVDKKAITSSDARVFCTLRSIRGRWHILATPPVPRPIEHRARRPARRSSAPSILRELETNGPHDDHNYGGH